MKTLPRHYIVLAKCYNFTLRLAVVVFSAVAIVFSVPEYIAETQWLGCTIGIILGLTVGFVGYKIFNFKKYRITDYDRYYYRERKLENKSGPKD